MFVDVIELHASISIIEGQPKESEHWKPEDAGHPHFMMLDSNEGVSRREESERYTSRGALRRSVRLLKSSGVYLDETGGSYSTSHVRPVR